MNRRPLILASPSTQRSGIEMQDHAISLGSRYLDAILDAGGLPLTLPLTTDRAILAEAVRQCDGVMITGGDDIAPGIYWPDVPESLLKTCDLAEPARDVMELELLREVFEQRKPLLAICRGHQLVNVMLGGTLHVDIPSERPGAFRHSQMDRKYEQVHEITVAADSRLAAIWKQTTLGVNSTHHQAVNKIAKPLRAVAHGPDGIIEACEFRPEEADLLPWFASIQFHPERLYSKFPEHARLFQAFVKACRDGTGQ